MPTTIAEPQTRQRERFTGRKVSSLTTGDLDRARAAGYEPSGTDDWLIGRDPRDMTQDELRAMGACPDVAARDHQSEMFGLLRRVAA